MPRSNSALHLSMRASAPTAPLGADGMEQYTTFGWAKLCAQVNGPKIERPKPEAATASIP